MSTPFPRFTLREAESPRQMLRGTRVQGPPAATQVGAGQVEVPPVWQPGLEMCMGREAQCTQLICRAASNATPVVLPCPPHLDRPHKCPHDVHWLARWKTCEGLHHLVSSQTFPLAPEPDHSIRHPHFYCIVPQTRADKVHDETRIWSRGIFANVRK